MLAIMSGAGASVSVQAQGRYAHPQAHGGYAHPQARIGVYVGVPLWRPYWRPGWYPPPAYGYYPRYPYPPYYGYPPYAVVPAPSPPVVYIERSGPESAPEGAAMQWWYYCTNPDGYYPYVRDCPGGWRQVAPQPPPPP